MAFRGFRRLSNGSKSFLTVGVPFLSFMVVASYALTAFTQIKYDVSDKRRKRISEAEMLELEANRKPFNIQEEYWKLTTNSKVDDWDYVRVPRPKGQ
ncbi:cytochrome c oxidase assembly protein COX16 [Cladochytrium replicatum]|nr:cytochrome c oxidase assembly protein COX16 [Cladochytrium replicatum]